MIWASRGRIKVITHYGRMRKQSAVFPLHPPRPLTTALMRCAGVVQGLVDLGALREKVESGKEKGDPCRSSPGVPGVYCSTDLLISRSVAHSPSVRA